MRKPQAGFTIVELLIVIVVIAILAAISIVAYNGIQSRARDTQRVSEMHRLKLALETYYVDNGFYPLCNGSGVCSSTGYSQPISMLPVTPPIGNDPLNASTQYGYYYARGYKKASNSSFTNTGSAQDYIIGTRLENNSGSSYSGWNNTSLNFLDGN